MRSCSPLWDDFWFCMRTKGYAGPMREDAIREHYRQKDRAKYGPGLPSSEDIWEARRERLPPGSAFSVPYQPPDETDEQFQQRQMEKFKRTRAELERLEEEGTGKM